MNNVLKTHFGNLLVCFIVITVLFSMSTMINVGIVIFLMGGVSLKISEWFDSKYQELNAPSDEEDYPDWD